MKWSGRLLRQEVLDDNSDEVAETRVIGLASIDWVRSAFEDGMDLVEVRTVIGTRFRYTMADAYEIGSVPVGSVVVSKTHGVLTILEPEFDHGRYVVRAENVHGGILTLSQRLPVLVLEVER